MGVKDDWQRKRRDLRVGVRKPRQGVFDDKTNSGKRGCSLEGDCGFMGCGVIEEMRKDNTNDSRVTCCGRDVWEVAC